METIAQPQVNEREQQAESLLTQLVDFCALHGPPHCYRDWPRATIENYILFHMKQKTFVFVRTSGAPCGAATSGRPPEIAGCGIVWQGFEKDIRQRLQAGLSPFRWQPTDANGDALFIEEFVANSPRALRVLVRHFKNRFPHWRNLHRLTLRKERLKVYA